MSCYQANTISQFGTPLCCAVMDGRTDIVELLLQYKVSYKSVGLE